MALTGKWIEGIAPDSLVADAARRSLETRLATVSQCLPLAAYLAEHDVEHVHRLRVATRRAGAALKLYRDFLPRKNARWIKKRLRKMRRAAGEARDLDVLADRVQREFPNHAAVVLPLVQCDRAAAQPAIVAAADVARRHDRFVRKTKMLLERIESSTDEADSQAAARFQVWAPLQLASIADAFMTALPGESSDTAALHQFRIRAKALRYAMELLAAGINPTLMEEQYPVIKELQDRLGGINDRVASAARFRRWASETDDDAQRQTLERLTADDAVRLTDDIGSFQQWWTTDQVERLQQALAVPPVAAGALGPASEDAQGK
jgi:CHAD domain-containing protein